MIVVMTAARNHGSRRAARYSVRTRPMRFGYNTNGFAHHRLEDVLPILAEIGYESVAITLDHFALNPFDKNLHRQMGEIRGWLEALRLRCVIETGSRFLLDSRRKHQPTLISANAWE